MTAPYPIALNTSPSSGFTPFVTSSATRNQPSVINRLTSAPTSCKITCTATESVASPSAENTIWMAKTTTAIRSIGPTFFQYEFHPYDSASPSAKLAGDRDRESPGSGGGGGGGGGCSNDMALAFRGDGWWRI